jgi:hypothetical protein
VILVAAVQKVAAPAAAGNPGGEKMLKEKQQLGQKHLAEFVDKLKSSAGANLVCVAVYGSAVSEEFHSEFSDVNLLCVVRELSAANLQALSPAIAWWTASRFPAPLVFARKEIERAADVFPIEMLDIRQQHHILYGEDIFQNLNVPLDRHRVQLEHELRTKLLFLRQHYLLSSRDDKKVRLLMLDSVSNFATLFRHTLLTRGKQPPKTKPEVIEQLAIEIQLDPSPFLELLQVREGKAAADSLDAQAVFARYLQGIERVVEALDAM